MIGGIAFSALQADVASKLAAATYLAGVTIEIEDDSTKTESYNAAIGDRWEKALETKGVVIGVGVPMPGNASTAPGSMAFRATVPVVVEENPAVNRATGGAGKPWMQLVEAVIAALVSEYEFDGEEPFTRPKPEEPVRTSVVLPRRLVEVSAA